MVLGDAFIDRLIKRGIVPENTIAVSIYAHVGEVTMMDYSVHILDEDLIDALTPTLDEVRQGFVEELKKGDPRALKELGEVLRDHTNP